MALLLMGCEGPDPARVQAPADPAAGEVAIEWAGPDRTALLVPVHVNGAGPYSFVLDTGATLTCIDQAIAGELGLPEATGQVGHAIGIGGAGRVTLARVDSLRVGAASAEGLRACVLDLPATEGIGLAFDGLLGLNFLRSFHLTLDFDREVLTLSRP